MAEPFRIEDRNQAGATVVVPIGELDVTNASELDRHLQELVAAADGTALILDLRELRFMDSTGLRTLLSANEACQAAGRRFAIVRGVRQIERLLTITRAGERLPMVDDPLSVLG